jgi:uncharacterized membrane protein
MDTRTVNEPREAGKALVSGLRSLGVQAALAKIGWPRSSSEAPDLQDGSAMNRMLIFVGVILGGYVGWWAGDYLGLGLLATFLVSTIGSIAGLYLAWRIAREYFD